ncbi:hypothetical protein U8V72_10835 [Priestia filamentosa]|uniref:hypothetical protein n=1 Tax=Priestia filamentosa TaxID=1402861 RepID=UPI00397C8C14
MKEEKNYKRKSRRLSRSEEEKRNRILSEILGKWVCVRDKYSNDKKFYFVKHILGERGKTSRIKQILISGYEEQDGIYEISDYEVGYVFDAITKSKIIEIKPKKFDLKYGLYSENDFAETYEDLIEHLVKEGHVTEKEVYGMLKGNKFHLNLEEIQLSYVRNYRSVNEGM